MVPPFREELVCSYITTSQASLQHYNMTLSQLWGKPHTPEIIVSSPNHHQAVLSPNLLPEIFHGFGMTLQGILPNDKEDWSLHIQEGIIHILKHEQVL